MIRFRTKRLRCDMGCAPSGQKKQQYVVRSVTTGDRIQGNIQMLLSKTEDLYIALERSKLCKKRLTSAQGSELLDMFLRIDRDIWREERAAPAPTLGHCMARLEKLNSDIAGVAASDMDTEVPGTIPKHNLLKLETDDDAIRRALIELRINRNPDHALEHEEFVANLTRKALKHHKLFWLTRRKHDTEDEINRLSERVQYLQKLYEQQDAILSEVLGSPASEPEVQLDRVRSYRDTLYTGELIWREAARLSQAGAALAKAGFESWDSLHNTINLDTRFRLTTDTRNAMQEAALCIQTAQSILPGVQFPYCTNREITAILQVIEYIYTDLQIVERYKHALEVYANLQRSSQSLSNWIRQMLEGSIKKDLYDVDQKITELSTRLCNERANLIRHETGLAAEKGNEIGSLNHRLRSDFERKMAMTRGNAWSSRRIEEHVNNVLINSGNNK